MCLSLAECIVNRPLPMRCAPSVRHLRITSIPGVDGALGRPSWSERCQPAEPWGASDAQGPSSRSPARPTFPPADGIVARSRQIHIGARLGQPPGRARKQARTVGRGSLKRSRHGASARSEIRPLARRTRGLNGCLRPGAFGGEARGPARAARMSPRRRGRRRDAISLSLRAGTYRIGGNIPLAAGARAAVRRTAR